MIYFRLSKREGKTLFVGRSPNRIISCRRGPLIESTLKIPTTVFNFLIMDSPKTPTPTERILMYFKRCAYSMSQRSISPQDKAAYAASIKRTAIKYADLFEERGMKVDREKIFQAVKFFD